MAGTIAGLTVQGLVGSIKEQLAARIQELEMKLINIKIKVKMPDIYYKDRIKLKLFFRGLDVYYTTHERISDLRKVLFAVLFL